MYIICMRNCACRIFVLPVMHVETAFKKKPEKMTNCILTSFLRRMFKFSYLIFNFLLFFFLAIYLKNNIRWDMMPFFSHKNKTKLFYCQTLHISKTFGYLPVPEVYLTNEHVYCSSVHLYTRMS